MPRLGLGSSLTGGAPPQEVAFSNLTSVVFDGTDDRITTVADASQSITTDDSFSM